MRRRGDRFPPRYQDKCAGRISQNNPDRENPDVNIPPGADEADNAIERAQLADRLTGGADNAAAREFGEHFRG